MPTISPVINTEEGPIGRMPRDELEVGGVHGGPGVGARVRHARAPLRQDVRHRAHQRHQAPYPVPPASPGRGYTRAGGENRRPKCGYTRPELRATSPVVVAVSRRLRRLVAFRGSAPRRDVTCKEFREGYNIAVLNINVLKPFLKHRC